MPEYITRDSGEREEYDSGMRRDTQAGKPDFSLITPLDVPFDQQMLTRWAALMARGAEKYGERNWELAASEKELARFKASAFRHFVQWLTGDSPEEDHAAAVFFNVTAAERIKGLGLPKDSLCSLAEASEGLLASFPPVDPARWCWLPVPSDREEHGWGFKCTAEGCDRAATTFLEDGGRKTYDAACCNAHQRDVLRGL